MRKNILIFLTFVLLKLSSFSAGIHHDIKIAVFPFKPLIYQDEKGNPKEVGSPYTNYTIQVLENIKGELITDKPIPIVKQGGISEKQDAIYLFENDSLPSENSIYIFFN